MSKIIEKAVRVGEVLFMVASILIVVPVIGLLVYAIWHDIFKMI